MKKRLEVHRDEALWPFRNSRGNLGHMQKVVSFICLLLASSLVACRPSATDAKQTSAIPFTPSNPLESLLSAATDADGAKAFEEAFLGAKVYVRVNKDTFEAAQKGPIRHIAMWTFELDGVATLPVYTSLPAFGSANPDKHYVVLTGREVLEAVADRQLAIDYGLSPAMLWTPEYAKDLLARDATTLKSQ